MDKVLPRVQRIHNPLIPGSPLLFLPDRVLVRWPPRVVAPVVGDPFDGTTVSIPRELREVVWTLLFGASPLARCDAAKRLAEDRIHRRRILLRIYSRPYVQQMLASANRLDAEEREQIEATGAAMPIRRLLQRIRPQ